MSSEPSAGGASGPSGDVDQPDGAGPFGRPSRAAGREPVLPGEGSPSAATYRASGGGTDWCHVRAVTVTGVRHRLNGEEGQDSFAWDHSGPVLAVSVADGVGSVPGSRTAADRAAVAAVAAAGAAAASAQAESGPDEGDGHACLEAVAAANEAADGHGATTLVIAVVRREGNVTLARVGDSTAFRVSGSDGTWEELFRSGVADNPIDSRTDALPDPSPAVDKARTVLQEGDCLALVTDGVADPWRDGPATVAPELAARIASRPSPLALAELADFSRHGCHDDRTMVLVWLG